MVIVTALSTNPSQKSTFFASNLFLCCPNILGDVIVNLPGAILRENYHPFFQKITTARSSMVMGVIVCLMPLSVLRFGFLWPCTGFSHTVVTTELICAATLLCPEDNIALSSPALVSYSFGLLFHNGP